MSVFKISKETKIVLIFVVSICIIGFLVAYFYYDHINQSEDPRVLETKFMFMRYNHQLKNNNHNRVFEILDSIKQVFSKVPGYSWSYELGIVYNNRASVYLSDALYVAKDSVEKKYLLRLSNFYIDTCILLYENWINDYGKLSNNEIYEHIKPFFPEDEKSFLGKNYKNILKKRVDDLILAQKETPRRLSVAYTNLGIIQRHQHKQNEALESYIKAIKLWKDNYTARNNLNVLYGKPPEDRSIIDKLFPPDKN